MIGFFIFNSLKGLLLSQIVHLYIHWASVAYLLSIFTNLQSCGALDVLDIGTHLEDIVACIYLPLAVGLIEASEVTLFEGHLQSLALTWLQLLSFVEGLELLGRLLVSTLRSGNINLSNFLAGNLTSVLDGYAYLDVIAFCLDRWLAKLEGSIAQTITERISHILLEGIKVAITYVDILLMVAIVVTLDVTLAPIQQILVGVHIVILGKVGGELNLMQIGKKKQLMYNAAYDRTGKNLGYSLETLASYSDRLKAAALPSWHSAPSLEAPIDDERLRFNTTQKYSINHIRKNKQDAESRIEANYLRQVVRQQRENTSVYNLGGEAPITTTEQNHKTMINDVFRLEWENKVNQTNHYGNENISLNVSQNDGLSNINDTLTQRIRIPKIDIAGSLYRLFVFKKSQLSWRSTADYHHGVSDLYVNDDRNRLRSNLWHTAHALSWQKNRFHWMERYQVSIDANNIHIKNEAIGAISESCLNLTGKVSPYWQYKTETFKISFSPDLIWERFTYPKKTLWAVSPFVYLNKKLNFRQEMTTYFGYTTSTGDAKNYALSQYRRSYRSWYVSGDIIPVTRSLYGNLSYEYKRPIKEVFFSASINANRFWMNTASDLRIVNGNYYTSLYKQDSKSDNIGGSLYISKGFYDLHLKTRLTASYNYSQGEQYSSGKAIGYTANTYSLKPSIDYSPSWCALSYEGEFTKYDSKSPNQAVSSLFNWKQTFSATATISHIDLTFSLVHYHNELQGGSKVNTLLGDASAVWRMKKLRLSAELRNLFNKKNYMETIYSGISTLTDSYHLRPRELMISAQYSF